MTDRQSLIDLHATLRAFFATRGEQAGVPLTNVNDSGFDSDTWATMCDLDLAGLLVPTRLGGSEAPLRFVVAAMEEAGRTLLPSPLFGSSVMAAALLMASDGGEHVDDALGNIARGDEIIGAAASELTTGWTGGHRTTAFSDSSGWVVDGQKCYVVDGGRVSRFIVIAAIDDNPALLLVAAAAEGVSVAVQETIDLTRQQAVVTFDRAPAVCISASHGTAGGVERAHQIVKLLLAAEQLGGAGWCLDTTVNYVSQRVQFGHPIGSFQAVRHGCADMYVALQAARSLVYAAAESFATDREDFSQLVLAAAARTSDMYVASAWQTVHLHGGLGFTWEHRAHLHVRRAQSSAVLLGHPDTQRELLIRDIEREIGEVA
jgi:alkylation response protein AidB-like acyl-CoA dehydrogenase